LSGDHPNCVASVARQLRIGDDMAMGDLSPESKLQTIRQSQGAAGPVVMVGDGVNDSAALAAADVGVAVRGGAETSLQAAPVFLADGSLGGLSDLMLASRRTVRLIYRTFAVSLAYNAVAVALAMAGMVHPLTAALIMPASSITVLTMILATGTFRERDR
jgi:Cu2+-exporting ATPase